MYSHDEVCSFKCADFSIWSECNSCDQAGFLLVRIAYCYSTLSFYPLLFISHPLSSLSQHHFLSFWSSSPAVCSVCLFFGFINTSEYYNMSFKLFKMAKPFGKSPNLNLVVWRAYVKLTIELITPVFILCFNLDSTVFSYQTKETNK